MNNIAIDADGRMSGFEKWFVNRGGHSKHVADHAERLLQEIPRDAGRRFLDVGTGTGAVAIRAVEAFGYLVHAVDVDPAQNAVARTLVAPVRFQVADARVLPFGSAAFDVVFSNKVTHHVRPWLAAVAEMERVLRPGGYLVWSDLVVPAGGRYPTRRAIERFLADRGFEVVRRSGSPFQHTVIARKPV